MLVRGMGLFKDFPLGLATRPVCFNQDIKALVVKEGIHAPFIFHQLSARRTEIMRMVDAAGHGTGRLDTDRLKSAEIWLPPFQAQREIAAFLDTVAERIALAERRRDGLVDYKRGLMQALFSRRLRFHRDDGTEFPEWTRRPIFEIADIIGGGTPESGRAEYWGGSIPWLTPTEVGPKYLAGSKRTLTDAGLRASSARLLPIGAVVLSTRATVGEAGIATARLATNQGFQSLIVSVGVLNEYVYYWIAANKHEFIRRAAGSTFLEIGKAEVGRVTMDLPHPDEQRKIADALTALDDRIAAANARLDALKEWRRGLLQKMFVR